MVQEEFIDSHVHLWTSDISAYPLAAGTKIEDMSPLDFRASEYLPHAKPRGVGRAVLIQMSFYGFDNRFIVDTIANHPSRFVGVAVVDESSTELEQELDYLQSRGVVGLRLSTLSLNTHSWLQHQATLHLLHEAQDRGLIAGFLCSVADLAAIAAQRPADQPVHRLMRHGNALDSQSIFLTQ